MTTASVPGKLILLGEHAAVYGRPALVAAVGLRLTATVVGGDAGGERGGVRIRLGDTDAALPWSEVLACADAARAAWERYAADPGPESFAALAGAAGATGESGGPLHLLRIALGEAVRAAGEAEPEPIELRIASEIPIGSGFGSSAAAAVGVVLAYLAHRGHEASADLLHRVSLEVERRQHGSPSGVDNATVIHGGILEARRSGEGAVRFEPLRPGRASSPILDAVRVFGTGAPAEGTGTVVAAVRELRRREPARIEAALDRLAALTDRLRTELEGAGARPGEVIGIVREAEARLEELGVVPEPVRRLVRRVEAEGGAAKVSGAGSLAGPGAGNLIVYHPEPERIGEWPFLAGLDRYDLELGAPGARIETEGP